MSSDCAAAPADTSPEVWKLQITAIRNKSVSERLALAEQRQQWMRQAELDFLTRRFPAATATELTLERIRHRHGDDLAKTIEPLVLARSTAGSAESRHR